MKSEKDVQELLNICTVTLHLIEAKEDPDLFKVLSYERPNVFREMLREQKTIDDANRAIPNTIISNIFKGTSELSELYLKRRLEVLTNTLMWVLEEG